MFKNAIITEYNHIDTDKNATFLNESNDAFS